MRACDDAGRATGHCREGDWVVQTKQNKTLHQSKQAGVTCLAIRRDDTFGRDNFDAPLDGRIPLLNGDVIYKTVTTGIILTWSAEATDAPGSSL
jgi:hypothetical protein